MRHRIRPVLFPHCLKILIHAVRPRADFEVVENFLFAAYLKSAKS
jgi:hypothetical protein